MIETHEFQHPPKVRYIVALGMIVLGIGVLFYHYSAENLSWVDSLYFCVITLTTIGYGDITPQTDGGKLFTSAYAVIGIGIFAAVINFLIRRGAINRIQKHQDKNKDK